MGIAVGTAVGVTVGEIVVGVAVGIAGVGTGVGTRVGTGVGILVGIEEGVQVGVFVGTGVGIKVGAPESMRSLLFPESSTRPISAVLIIALGTFRHVLVDWRLVSHEVQLPVPAIVQIVPFVYVFALLLTSATKYLRIL